MNDSQSTRPQYDNADQKNLVRIANRDTKKVFFKKRRGCPLGNVGAEEVNYKNPVLLAKFMSECHRILPSRITNVSAKKQRMLTRAIKIARILALL
jgi:small subunit ribosomal protein S18